MSIETYEFWSSDILTGSQTKRGKRQVVAVFWSSDILTGSQTGFSEKAIMASFWSSDILTGSQTRSTNPDTSWCFGAVTY